MFSCQMNNEESERGSRRKGEIRKGGDKGRKSDQINGFIVLILMFIFTIYVTLFVK